MATKLIDKLMKDWKSINNRLEFYESLYEINVEATDDFVKNSIEHYRKEKKELREVLVKQFALNPNE